MERIIKIDDALYNRVKEKIVTLSDIPVLCKAVDDSTPYKPSGDAISREALKEALTSETRDKFEFVCLSRVLEKIDNAQAVEHSLLPLTSEADNAYMRGYEVGKAEGIMKASTRPKGEWTVTKLLHGEDVTCPFCNARPTKSAYGYYLRDKFCHECGADMRKGDAE